MPGRGSRPHLGGGVRRQAQQVGGRRREELVRGAEAKDGHAVVAGQAGQGRRAQLVDQRVRQHGIGAHPHHACAGQPVQQRHVGAVIDGNAVRVQGQGQCLALARRPRLAHQHAPQAALVVGMAQGGHHRGAVGVREHRGLRRQHRQGLPAEARRALLQPLPPGLYRLAQPLAGAGCRQLGRAGLQHRLRQVEQDRHAGLRRHQLGHQGGEGGVPVCGESKGLEGLQGQGEQRRRARGVVAAQPRQRLGHGHARCL
ncbi:MAG: hypothetical protein KatS3mg131_0008 [Candidatus Tectimicrobiota bacterium]|nr:MAG: hypothetical protein KatS3mg131_0008 [Candidatus Tectomicrobia bacterium]